MAKIIKAKNVTFTDSDGVVHKHASAFLDALTAEIEFQRDREIVDYEGAISTILADWSWVKNAEGGHSGHHKPSSIYAFNKLTDSQIADILEMAADILERDGWTKGAYEGVTGSHCAVGAIRVALRDLNLNQRKEGQVCTELLPGIGLKVPLLPDGDTRWNAPSDIIRWNDSQAETSYQVIDLFRNTAKDLRNRAVAE